MGAGYALRKRGTITKRQGEAGFGAFNLVRVGQYD
jgi:hypothetical protein